MYFKFDDASLYIWGLTHQLGSQQRSLEDLKSAGLLGGAITELAQTGYRFNYGIDDNSDLLSLAAPPFSALLKQCGEPGAVVVHHSYGVNATLPWEATEKDIMSRARYFPAALLKQFALENQTFFGSFGSGCTGFLSLIIQAGGLLVSSEQNPVLCLTADVRPPGAHFDAVREKILTSDSASGFIVGRERRGFQLLGLGYYSTCRTYLPLVEIVKRSVQMIRELGEKLRLDLSAPEILVHYPNIFPEAWNMISRYLKISKEHHILDGLTERSHCLSSDSVISLQKLQGGASGRLHIVVNFGSGLHLGVCILKEV